MGPSHISLPVVVGVDGSQHSKRALAWAVDYAQLSGAPLRIICAWEIHGTFGGDRTCSASCSSPPPVVVVKSTSASSTGSTQVATETVSGEALRM